MKRLFSYLIPAFLVFAGCAGNQEPDVAPPVIKADAPSAIPATGDETYVTYEVENPVASGQLSAEAKDSWLKVSDVSPNKVTLTADVYVEDTPRETKLTLKYPGAKDVVLDVVQNAPEVKKDMTFDIQVLEVGARSVKLNCIPSDPNATFVAMSTTKEDFARHATEKDLVESNLQYFLEWGPSFGSTSDEESIKMFLRTGPMENYEITLPTPEADYVFYAYGMNVDGTVTSPKVFKVDFKTEAPGQENCTFEFIVRPGITYTQINVKPSSINVSYIWGISTKAEYDALGSNPAQKIVDDLKEKVKHEQELGGDANFGDYVVYHNRKISKSDLIQGEEYVVYAFGCDVKGYVTTPIMTQSFVEKRVEKLNCSFTTSFESCRASSFVAKITPSDNNIRWFGYTLPYDMLENYTSVESMTEEVIDILYGMNIDFATDTEFIHSGEQLLSNYDLMGGDLAPKTKQLVAVFGINSDGHRVTDIAQTFVTTVAAGTPSDLRVDIDANATGWSSAKATFTPSKSEVYFYDVVPKSVYDEYEKHAPGDKNKKDALFMNDMIFHYSNSGLLQYKMSVGAAGMTIDAGLAPGTEYIAYSFGVDAGQPCTSLFTRVFKTESLPVGGTSSVTDIDVVIYDGDKLYAENPSVFADFKGNAGVSFNMKSDPAGAKKYIYLNSKENIDAIPAAELPNAVVGYGDEYKEEQIIYLISWDTPLVALGLAMDDSGKAGKVFRKDFTPKKSDVRPASVSAMRPAAEKDMLLPLSLSVKSSQSEGVPFRMEKTDHVLYDIMTK